MNKTEMVKLARELHSIHGLLPVPVAGKIPIGGKGWNTAPLEVRMKNIHTIECTGVGVQLGLVDHPVLGLVEVRCIDCDITDQVRRNAFANTLNTFFQPTHWRWGRGPATLIITDPGIIKNEKFGPHVQLLGEGKQVVWVGEYRNKLPQPNDPREYWHEGTSIFDQMPPRVPAEILRTALEASSLAAGYPPRATRTLIDATPLTAADLAMLTTANLERFKQDMQAILIDVDNSPAGSGRGTKLFNAMLKYGALVKASGTAPSLIDAMYEVCFEVVEYEVVDNPILAEIGRIAEETFLSLPGSLNQGDQRDFARGVGISKGFSQHIAVQIAKQLPPMPNGHLGQTLEALLAENIQPQKFLVNRFFPESGCIVLAGKPKVGKGWIILELGLSIAEGGKFWSEQCEQGQVLMYMLEDGKRRITERVKILRPQGFNYVRNIRFLYSNNGPFYVNADGTGTLLDNIREQMRQFPGLRLIVIDVLQRIRGDENKKDNAYQQDYKLVGAIQKLSVEFNVLIIIIHHTKKGKVEDAIDSISGSFGLSASADGAIVIGKQGDVVKIESRMRDIAEFEFEMTKEGNSPMWKPAQTLVEMFAPSSGTKTHEVMMALHAARCALGPKDIAIRTSINEKNVSIYLSRLIKSNQITKPVRGWYMAVGMPYRERILGVIDLLKRIPKTPATDAIKAQYAPNGVPPEASYMILTPVAIKEIEAGFNNGKDCLNSLKLRGLAITNSDTTWLLGNDWDEAQLVQQPVPFAFKMPWEV